MCVEAKTNRDSLVNLDLNQIEQLWDELSRSVNLGFFDSFTLLSIKNGRGLPRMLYDVTCFQFDLVMMQLLLHESHGRFLTNLIQVN